MLNTLFQMLQHETIKEYTDLKHYSFNYLVGVLNHSILCYLIFIGFNEKFDSFIDILTSFLVWFVGKDLIIEMSSSIHEEKKEGTLELIYQNSNSLILFIFVKSLIAFLSSILFFSVISIFIYLFSTNTSIAYTSDNLWLKFIFTIISLIGCLGYGFIFSGLGLLFRKSSAIVSIFTYLLMFKQFIELEGSYKYVYSIIPGGKVSELNSYADMNFINIFIFVIGIIVFKISLNLSIKSGYFWRK